MHLYASLSPAAERVEACWHHLHPRFADREESRQTVGSSLGIGNGAQPAIWSKHQLEVTKTWHLRRLGRVKARRKGNRSGTRGRTWPARVVRHCPLLLPIHIHTLHTPVPFILLFAKAIVLLKKKQLFQLFDNNVQGLCSKLYWYIENLY